MNNPIRALKKTIYLIAGILAFGTVGYMAIEELVFIDALYMTVQTIATIGAYVQHTFTNTGKAFTILLIFLSFGTFAYAISQLTQIVLDGSLRGYLKNMYVQKEIDKLENHVIICGFGRNGKQAATKIRAYKQPLVVIDTNLANIQEGLKQWPDLLFLHGDATQDALLEAAGAGRAKALISALHDDVDNLFVVVSARQINPKMRIVSRANTTSTERKLIAAGANYTVSPNMVGGSHLAHNLMKPDVVEFLDRIDIGGTSSSYIEEVLVSDLPSVNSASQIQDLEIRKRTGCNIIGYKSSDGNFVINPGPNLILQPNSKLFVLGDDKQIEKLRAFISA